MNFLKSQTKELKNKNKFLSTPIENYLYPIRLDK